MNRKITARDYLPRLERECRSEIDSYVIDTDGTMYRKGRQIDLLAGPAACSLSLKHAVAFKLGGDKSFASFARACLVAAEKGLCENGGMRFWAQEITPSLCTHGRWIRSAYYAAMAIDDHAALTWLADILVRWPYLKSDHRYVERWLAGPAKATSVDGFSHSINMVTEGAVDSWLLGAATGNRMLMDRCEDELLHFVLPAQRDDGHWNYRARSPWMTDKDNLGPEEFNYSFYTALLLSNLLAFPQWKDRILGPVQRSYDALRRSFESADGSLYAPVHWGPNHVWEGTLFSMTLAWRLYRHAGLPQYQFPAVRAAHWEEVAQTQHAAPAYFFDRHTLEMMVDDFVLEGDVAETSAIVETLKLTEKRLATPPGNNMQYGRYFGDLPLIFAIQRKVQALTRNDDVPDRLEIPRHPLRSPALRVAWDREPNILNAAAVFAWDQQFLYADFTIANDAHWQPYTGLELFRGDGIILQLPQPGGRGVRINLALIERGPVVFRYNPEHDFGVYRSWLGKYPQEGDELTGSTLEVTNNGRQVCYRARLAWQDLSFAPAPRIELPLSFAVTKIRPLGFQHVSWGRDPFDSLVGAEPGTFVLL